METSTSTPTWVNTRFLRTRKCILYVSELASTFLSLILLISAPYWTVQSAHTFHGLISGLAFISTAAIFVIFLLGLEGNVPWVRNDAVRWNILELIQSGFFMFFLVISSAVQAGSSVNVGTLLASAIFGFLGYVAYCVHTFSEYNKWRNRKHRLKVETGKMNGHKQKTERRGSSSESSEVDMSGEIAGVGTEDGDVDGLPQLSVVRITRTSPDAQKRSSPSLDSRDSSVGSLPDPKLRPPESDSLRPVTLNSGSVSVSSREQSDASSDADSEREQEFVVVQTND